MYTLKKIGQIRNYLHTVCIIRLTEKEAVFLPKVIDSCKNIDSAINITRIHKRQKCMCSMWLV